MMAHLSSLLHSFLHSLIMSILGKTSFSVSVGGSHVNVYTGSFLSFGFFFFEVIIMRRNDVRLREREREMLHWYLHLLVLKALNLHLRLE